MPKYLKERGSIGAVPILILLAAVGLLGFLLISNTADFRDTLFNRLFPKPPSEAVETSQEARDLTNQLLQAAKTKNQSVLFGTALKRKEIMAQAAKDIPEIFLNNTLPDKFTKKLPKSVADLIEKKVSIKGEATVIVSDTFETGASSTEYFLENYSIKFPKVGNPDILTGDLVEVTGYALDSLVVVDTTLKNSVRVTASARRQEQQVEHKTAVMLINFTDNLDTKDFLNLEITKEDVEAKFRESLNQV